MPRDRPIIATVLALLVASCATQRPPRAGQAVRRDRVASPGLTVADADLAATVQRALGAGLAQIDVRVTEGIVELRGGVPHLWAAERAARVAQGIAGVRAVSNQIVVEPVARTDREIAADMERVLRLDRYVEADAIDLEVESGRVTLRGTVDSTAERERVQRIAMSIRGAREVEDLVVVAPVPRIDAEVNRANVQLTGEVASAAEKARAEKLARVAGDLVDGTDLELGPMVIAGRAEAADVGPDAIVQAVVDAMRIDPRVDHRTIGVAATGSVVRLSGTADDERARRVAEDLARSTVGVSDVGNDIVVPAADTANVRVRVDALEVDHDATYNPAMEARIRDNLVWSAGVRVQDVRVHVIGESATLTGRVDTWEERQAAVAAAYAGGATSVIDELRVGSGT